jgi:hypothetical protein
VRLSFSPCTTPTPTPLGASSPTPLSLLWSVPPLGLRSILTPAGFLGIPGTPSGRAISARNIIILIPQARHIPHGFYIPSPFDCIVFFLTNPTRLFSPPGDPQRTVPNPHNTTIGLAQTLARPIRSTRRAARPPAQVAASLTPRTRLIHKSGREGPSKKSAVCVQSAPVPSYPRRYRHGLSSAPSRTPF